MAEPPDYPTPFRLRIFVTVQRYGWSEVYWLCTSDLTQALAWGRDLCDRRRTWYGDGVYTEYAEISRGNVTRDTWAIPVDDIAHAPTWFGHIETPQDAQCGLLFRFQTDSKRWVNRLFKGVPDDWIKNIERSGNAILLQPYTTPTPFELPPFPGTPDMLPPVTHAFTGVVLRASLLNAMLTYTGALTFGHTPNDPNTWSVEPYTWTQFRMVSNRQSSHPFRKVSCESCIQHTPTGWQGPNFDFCGMCVGVCRTCYYAPCRWYVGGPVWGIRFYVVSTFTPVYYGQLRFGPKISEPNYTNGPQTGELTSLGPRVYYNGVNVLPARDGHHPDITPEEAAGQAHLPPALMAEAFPWRGRKKRSKRRG